MPENIIPSFRDELKTLPEHMRWGIENYVMRGIKPGDFLQAVICNDFYSAVQLADHTNKRYFKEYVQFFKFIAPPQCRGSEAKFWHWMYTANQRGPLVYDERGNLRNEIPGDDE